MDRFLINEGYMPLPSIQEQEAKEINGEGSFARNEESESEPELWAFAIGGCTAMQRATQWNLDFTEHNEQELSHRVDKALGFTEATGVTLDQPLMTTAKFLKGHECLLLPSEQTLTRKDSTSKLYYDCSTHILWDSEQTCKLDGAQAEFLRVVTNPQGIKVGDKMDANETVKPIEILNPLNKVGKINIIIRMGVENMTNIRNLDSAQFSYWFLSRGGIHMSVYRIWDPGGFYFYFAFFTLRTRSILRGMECCYVPHFTHLDFTKIWRVLRFSVFPWRSGSAATQGSVMVNRSSYNWIACMAIQVSM